LCAIAEREWERIMKYYLTKTIDAPFEEAISRSKTALAAHGFDIAAEFDLAAVLKGKLGVDIQPYRILAACNARYVHRALKLEPLVGTILPCNVIVRQATPGRVEVAAIDPVASMQAVENPRLAKIACDVRRLLLDAVDAV
jgi:uncharacterized protein (DUF302 family)